MPLAEGENHDHDTELARVIRYANRVPLLFQQSACSTFKAVLNTTWRNYGMTQSRGALPAGPMVIFVHMASVWVPFTSESKEAIADYDEIQKEITLALYGRQDADWGFFCDGRNGLPASFGGANIFDLYIEEVVEACNRLKGGKLPTEQLKEQLHKIASSRTGGFKTDEALGKTGAGPEGLPHSIIVTTEGIEGETEVVQETAAVPVAANKPAPSERHGETKAPMERVRASKGRPARGMATGPATSKGKIGQQDLFVGDVPPGKKAAAPKRKRTVGDPYPQGEIGQAMAQAKPKKNGAVEKKLIGMADVVIGAAQRAKDPTFAIPIRALSNVSFNPRKGLIEMGEKKQARSFFNVGMAKKFMQTMLVADALSELQRADLTTSLREIYYRTKHTIQDSHENTFDTQDESDPIIEDLEVSLVALREELHVRAENSGSIVGPVVFGDDGDRVDCAKLGKGGYSVPSIVEPEYLEIRRCTADFLLLVEKGTQWNRLSEDKFWRRYNCVLLTGNGQPPRGVRRLARRLHEEYRLPVYVLVDNDPWGYYIYSVVKQGSINLAFESQRMAIPKAKFIGLSSADPERYELPRNVGIKLNDKDITRAKELLNYRWFQKPAWQEEIKRMLANGLKFELDALANKDFQYLTKKYLPRKLKEKDWLD